jgi:glycosyltransferase involved in cell wall biosynthesis
VDLKMFETAMTQSEARRVLNLPDDSPIVLYTGSLKPDRGIDLILDAAAQLPDMRFIIVGGTPSEMDRVRSQMEKQNIQNVQLTGRVPHRDIPQWLSSADILLMMWTWQVSTIRVCSPMKLFEYMAAKRLIVGPAFPTVLEVLENGKDSILFEPDNIAAIVSSLREARLRMKDSAMPDAAYRKVAANYTWTARCRRILDSLPDVVKQK